MPTPSPVVQCSIVGIPALHGIGIRLSLYLLWFGFLLSIWIPQPSTFLVLLATHTVIVWAIYIGLVATVATASSSGVTAAEVYVTILLVSGIVVYARIPYCVWRVVTCFRDDLNPGFYYYHFGQREWEMTAERESGGRNNLFAFIEWVFLFAVLGLQLWFWCSGVESDALSLRQAYAMTGKNSGGGKEFVGCEEQRQQVGFLFAQAELRNPVFRALNVVVVFAVVVLTILVNAKDAAMCGSITRARSRRQRRRRLRMTYVCFTLKLLSQQYPSPSFNTFLIFLAFFLFRFTEAPVN